MTLTEAIEHVQSHDKCSRNNAHKQLSDALADRQIRSKWTDEDVEVAGAPSYSLLTVPPMPPSDENSGEAKEPQVPAEAKANPVDQAKLAEFRTKWKPQRAELETRGYLDRAIEAITEIAYRKTEIAYKQGITSALAAAIYDLEHPPPPILQAEIFAPPTINRARILTVPAFWREVRYRRGKVFDPTCDRWREPLVNKADIRRLWPNGTPKPEPEVRQEGVSNTVPLHSAKRKVHGRDYRELDRKLVEDMHAMIKDGTAKDPTDAARQLANKAEGGGTEESKMKRLVLRYGERFFSAMVKSQRSIVQFQ